MEFTQPLGVGLGLVVRINIQYCHQVCTGRRTETYATINDTWEISQENWLLTWEHSHGYWGIHGNGIPCGQCADDADRQVAVDDVMWKLHKMITQINCTNESHKQITQNNHVRQDDVTSRNGNDEQCFWMLQSNSGAYGGPDTGKSNRNMSKSKG